MKKVTRRNHHRKYAPPRKWHGLWARHGDMCMSAREFCHKPVNAIRRCALRAMSIGRLPPQVGVFNDLCTLIADRMGAWDTSLKAALLKAHPFAPLHIRNSWGGLVDWATAEYFMVSTPDAKAWKELPEDRRELAQEQWRLTRWHLYKTWVREREKRADFARLTSAFETRLALRDINASIRAALAAVIKREKGEAGEDKGNSGQALQRTRESGARRVEHGGRALDHRAS